MRRCWIFVAGSPNHPSPRAGDPGTDEGPAPIAVWREFIGETALRMPRDRRAF